MSCFPCGHLYQATKDVHTQFAGLFSPLTRGYGKLRIRASTQCKEKVSHFFRSWGSDFHHRLLRSRGKCKNCVLVTVRLPKYGVLNAQDESSDWPKWCRKKDRWTA
ncbi:hypothetical protein POVWA2_031080 [Plasmodium ovale wallikeri]|uniref:Uncharacterized protein n=1 Tax=Plasmodium ovale wallikeri TaxID=864142 RepID=A0A1A8YXB7_PLAOA|nr:hypothetical protein POVWA1_031360 [Plasmodium ovale wallikeri]SBT36622.1 hypothetical protein POVWA2_031080 [Plasmodium ovale wallikeri]